MKIYIITKLSTNIKLTFDAYFEDLRETIELKFNSLAQNLQDLRNEIFCNCEIFHCIKTYMIYAMKFFALQTS